MVIAFIGIFGGSEEAHVRGETVLDLLDWAWKSDHLPNHPRLRRITIRNNKGEVVWEKKGPYEMWQPECQSEEKTIFEHMRFRLLKEVSHE